MGNILSMVLLRAWKKNGFPHGCLEKTLSCKSLQVYDDVIMEAVRSLISLGSYPSQRERRNFRSQHIEVWIVYNQ
ncbi:unnamed protein product [Blumeria hordei]|uniref:Uncharacterized protein n=1 Tax=Blumeria hordei TaxID=2867405 RepID=A0A383UQV6_BLUHO|nr:unnamed protein product [Blumeria hordei]